jgi:hypothetical protein
MHLKQEDVKIPEDFGGAHYYEYKLSQLDEGLVMLRGEIEKWAKSRDIQAEKVRAIRDS